MRRSLWAVLLAIVIVGGATEDYNSDSSFDQGNYNQLLVCDHSPIMVASLTILCDSRGSYYYGGPNYRNSETCREGDKARLKMTFEIVQDLTEIPTYLTIFEFGGPQRRDLLSYDSLCGVDGLQHSWRTTCPQTGNYTLTLTFNYSAYGADDDSIFFPYASAGFASGHYGNLFDLGGANTTYCAENVIVTWSKKQRGFLSFLWSIFIFIGALAVFGSFIYLVLRRDPRNPPGRVCWDDIALDDDDDTFEFDDKKWHLVGGRNDILEFA